MELLIEWLITLNPKFETEMQNLLSHSDGHLPLISYQQKEWSQSDFVQEVENATNIIQLQTDAWDKNDFVMLNEKHPVRFYSYLLALIITRNRVVVPNRDFFNQTGAPIYFASKILTPQNGKLSVDDNPLFQQIIIPSGNIIVFSSGSTGACKGIVHDFHNFIFNAKSVIQLLNFNHHVNLTWLPPYLVSSISHFLCHWMSNSHIFYDDFENLNSLHNLVSEIPNLGVVGSPVHIINAGHILPENHAPAQFFSSGDSISTHAVKKILDKFPKTTFNFAYGLAEVAGRFFINSFCNSTEYTLDIGKAINNFTPIVDDDRMLVKTPYLFDGYILNGEFRPASEIHDTGDIVSVRNGRIYLIGRSNDEIKVLGNKLNIKNLETRIKDILETDDLVIVVANNLNLGNLIALVMRPRDNLSRQQIICVLRSSLEKYEIPHLYFTIDNFPLTHTLKIDRNCISAGLNNLNQLL